MNKSFLLSLKGVNLRLVSAIFSVASFRVIFNFTKSLKVRASIPFHLVLEESHRYVQNDNDIHLLGYNIFERIAKEGRKFGMILNLI